MQILKDKETNIVITSMSISAIEEVGVIRCDNVIYAGCTLENSEIIEVEALPMRFVNGCYRYVDGDWFCEFPSEVEKVFPTPTVTMRQARLCLLNRGLLDDVESHVATLSRAAQIEWEFSTVVKMDYLLVEQIKTLLNMTIDDLASFFSDASKL
jgi:hypothetical protein